MRRIARTVGNADYMAQDGIQVPDTLVRKTILAGILGIVGALTLGVGMCFAMVWSNMVLGIIIGIVGIVILLSPHDSY